MSSEWTDELREEIISEYTGREPTEENSIEIVKELAEQYEKTPNGVRMILTKAGVYVKKSTANTEGKKKSTRVSKADSIAALVKVIEEQEKEVDDEILNKLTGKAAVYFTSLLKG